MVTVKKKTIGTKAYYYLEHSYRTEKGVEKKELYLGKELPNNLDAQKRNFLYEIYREKWFSHLDQIRQNYAREQKNLPLSAKEKERRTFITHFTYDTNRIEGSTLSLRETADLLERGISPQGKIVRDVKEAEAHDAVFQEALRYPKELSLQVVLSWHKKLFAATKPDIAGKIRNHGVAISGSKFMPPSPVEVPPLLDDFFTWYRRVKKKLHPVELAALVHLKLVSIHPFTDGNGRLSRLMMNFVLHKQKFPMFIIHYEGRTSYYTALERSQVKKDPSIFLNWFFRHYEKEQKRYLKKVDL